MFHLIFDYEDLFKCFAILNSEKMVMGPKPRERSSSSPITPHTLFTILASSYIYVTKNVPNKFFRIQNKDYG